MSFSDLVGLFKGAFEATQFLPSLLASLGGVWGLPLIVDKGDNFQAVRTLHPLEATDKVVIAVAAAIILSVIFKILRRSIVRLLEGYLPTRKLWAPFEWLQRKKRARWISERDELDKIEKPTPKQQSKLNRLALRLEFRCARTPAATLGTRLGNAYRAFEGYPRERYGFDGVAFWPRIHPFLSDPARENVSAGESTVDLLLTSTVLSFLAAAAVVLLEPLETATFVLTGAFLLLTYLLYRGVVESVVALGFAVRAGFDIGRKSFLEAMGYELPNTIEEERKLWREMSPFIIYNKPMTAPRKPPEAKTPESSSGEDVQSATKKLMCGIAGLAALKLVLDALRRKKRG